MNSIKLGDLVFDSKMDPKFQCPGVVVYIFSTPAFNDDRLIKILYRGETRSVYSYASLLKKVNM